MGERDTDDDAIAARREFVERLRTHDDVRRVNFSRDGFRMVIVALEPDADFRDRWRRTANRLGYTVERYEPDEPRPDRPGDVWALRLGESEKPTDRSGWWSTVRGAVARVRELVDRLLGRSDR